MTGSIPCMSGRITAPLTPMTARIAMRPLAVVT